MFYQRFLPEIMHVNLYDNMIIFIYTRKLIICPIKIHFFLYFAIKIFFPENLKSLYHQLEYMNIDFIEQFEFPFCYSNVGISDLI